ncbi:hypothetical protein AYL99_09787 [Fonsecaea erecta]|uniref:Uncharacterized protein n=1 Tax=Fonsecaea erecta TaxID=1367422 RepID=A0A178Z9B7_9EURO|nr:hypothetical protein AYL99_09787 [Fonsecaea erecta]OAP55635.1 hypothetical protein AYL99_09787 [Fonsecaea erecta]
MTVIQHVQPWLVLMVEPHPADQTMSRWRLIEEPSPHAPVAYQGDDPDVEERVTTMICVDGSRPTDVHIPRALLESIEKIGLHADHQPYLNTAVFPHLREIFDNGDVPYYVAQHLDRGGLDVREEEHLDMVILRNRAKIHSQVKPALPGWIRDVVDDPARQIELKIRISMDFRTKTEQQGPMRVSYTNGVVRIVSDAWLLPPANLTYCWRAGRPVFTVERPIPNYAV